MKAALAWIVYSGIVLVTPLVIHRIWTADRRNTHNRRADP